MANDRETVLLDLVRLRRPIHDVLRELSRYRWDEPNVVFLQVTDVEHALQAYENGEISGSDLSLWAESIEGRDDVGLPDDAHSVLTELLFEMSTPEINGAIDIERAHAWMQRLEGPSGGK